MLKWPKGQRMPYLLVKPNASHRFIEPKEGEQTTDTITKLLFHCLSQIFRQHFKNIKWFEIFSMTVWNQKLTFFIFVWLHLLKFQVLLKIIRQNDLFHSKCFNQKYHPFWVKVKSCKILKWFQASENYNFNILYCLYLYLFLSLKRNGIFGWYIHVFCHYVMSTYSVLDSREKLSNETDMVPTLLEFASY